MFALGTDNFVIAGVLPEIARGFHIGIGAAGQLTTIYALSFAFLAPTVAALAANVSLFVDLSVSIVVVCI